MRRRLHRLSTAKPMKGYFSRVLFRFDDYTRRKLYRGFRRRRRRKPLFSIKRETPYEW